MMSDKENIAFGGFGVTGQVIASLACGRLELAGLAGAALAEVLARVQEKFEHKILVITPEPEEAEDLVSDLGVFGGSALVLPAWDILPCETEHPDMDLAKERVNALKALHAGSGEIVVTSSSALLQPVLPEEILSGGQFGISPGMEISPEALLARLVDAGFEIADEVEYPGQFARRGGIVDVYPFFSQRPLRIEYLGDEVETVRYYDACTQRSDVALEHEVALIDINRDSFYKAYEKGNRVRLFSYLGEDDLVVLVYPQRIEYTADLYYSGFDKHSPLFDFTAGAEGIGRLAVVAEHAGEELSESWGISGGSTEFDFNCVTLERLTGGMETALRELELLLEDKNRILVYCNNAAERTRLEELLLERGGALRSKLELKIGSLSNGFHARSEKYVVTSDHEIMGRFQLRRKPKKRVAGAPIADFTELKTGDYVVHLSHGIARYEGLQTLDNNETQADYLRLRFADDAIIYVPLSHVDLVQRYIGGKDGKPKLSKLGSASWQKKKNAAAAAAKDIAADLLRLQAARNALPGTPFGKDGDLQNEFEAAFPYAETPDQLSAISDIKQDQQKSAPMDRLLCGDVGFGKTEVAMRAAFKVVEAGKQVAVLVPTTILAEQHYRTFSERMADYPVTVACLSRFRTPEQSRIILDRLETGGVDIVVGTHRVLSQDVKFRDLGLVVIDEEQRFGVEQKEKLKTMRVSVDILSMSATPIPRTLNMALLGLRDISNLATPPTERQSIKTEVVRFNDELIRRAILRELSRGGQVFFLHNRVHNIHRIARELGELIPEARFGVAHGQMPEKDLYRVMNNFIEKKLDVLVCTTIIESGVDIPSVNTLFVNNADHFGLSALHQLRGRVGRYRHKAYAYFLIPPKRPVTPIAQKRLRALEEYSELGAGFRLAMRDLEIRGAGNILGAEQSGHIHLIGFELYCRLLEKSVAELKGQDVEELEPVELDLGTMAYIPTDYISSDSQRIDFYRKLSSCYDNESLENLAGYLRDRYGKPPEMVLSLLEDQKLRQLAQEAGINYIGRIDTALVMGFAKNRGGPGLRKLRMLRRKVTSLEKARWRVSVGSGESLIDAAYSIVMQLQLSDKELESKKSKEPKKEKPAPKSAAGKDVRYQQINNNGVYAQRLKEKLELPVEKKEEGARIIAAIADQRLGTLGIVVDEDEFDLRRFGTVTLVCGEQRFFMRYTGASHDKDKRVTLNLRAADGDEVLKATEANLSCGGGRIFYGLVEE